MFRRGLWAFLVVLSLAVGGAGYLLYGFLKVEREDLDERLLVFVGGGGNSAVLLTTEGSVVIDTKFFTPASRLFEAVTALGPVRALINTHHHQDHTHGNPLFAPGTDVYAAAAAKGLMLRFDRDFWAKPPATLLLPNKPVESPLVVDFGEDKLEIVPLPPAHTGGDAAVLFHRRRVVHAGDVVAIGFYPTIDPESGGSIQGCIAATDRILALPFDTVIPGHGAIGTRADVEAMRLFYASLREHAQAAKKAGRSARQAATDAPPALLGRKGIPLFSSLQKNLEWAMAEPD